MVEYAVMNYQKKHIAFLVALSVVLIGSVFLVVKFANVNKNLGGVKNFLKNDTKSTNIDQGETQNASTQSSDLNIPANLPGGVSAGNLQAVAGKTGSATAVAISDGQRYALVIAANLPAPDNNQFYFGWLTTGEDDSNFVPLGKLDQKNGQFYLSFETDANYSMYQTIVITQERSADSKPEVKILVGEISQN